MFLQEAIGYKGCQKVCACHWRCEEAPPLQAWHSCFEGDQEVRDMNVLQHIRLHLSGTRSLPSCSSASCPSSALSVRLLRTSRLTWGSRALPWWLFRRPVRPTLWDSLRIPTSVPSMPRGSPSCPRTSSWQGGSVARGLDLSQYNSHEYKPYLPWHCLFYHCLNSFLYRLDISSGYSAPCYLHIGTFVFASLKFGIIVEG